MKWILSVFFTLAAIISQVRSEGQTIEVIFKANICAAIDEKYSQEAEEKFSFFLSGLTCGGSYAYWIGDGSVDSIKLDSDVQQRVLDIKEDTLYQDNIMKLLNGNQYQKQIGYQLVYLLQDSSYYHLMMTRLTEWKYDEVATLFSCLIHIYPMETDRFFDLLVNDAQEDMEGFSILANLYIKAMNTNSLIATFYKHTNDTNRLARILALQGLAGTDTSRKADDLIIKAVADWQLPDKGYAIVCLQSRKVIHCKELLQPYVNDTQLKTVVAETLYLSPFKEDVDYSYQLTTAEDRKLFDLHRQNEEAQK